MAETKGGSKWTAVGYEDQGTSFRKFNLNCTTGQEIIVDYEQNITTMGQMFYDRWRSNNNWQGVIIYPHREIENSPKSHYQEFFESGRVNCYYLNQLDEGDSLGVKVLQLIVESEQKTLEQGKELIQQVRQQFQESLKREDILELIETILIYKLPKLNRKEIEKMFSLSDLRETKVYQEALEEGREEGELSAKKSLILRQLNLKLGSIPLKVEQKIKQLNPNQLDNLALALLAFSDLEDLQQWLN